MREAAAGSDPIIKGVIKTIEATLGTQARTHVKRDAHPKMHGCVQAQLIVDAVPDGFNYGIFKKPGTYRAWVRFSNAFGNQHDLMHEPRGLAIKVLDVDGPRIDPLDPEDRENSTQDFLMVTHDAFFLRDPNDYVDFLPAVEHSLKIVRFFLSKFRRRWRGGVALLRSRGVLAPSPLAIEYFSQTPYHLGPFTVKLQARPILTTALRRSLPGRIGFRLKRSLAGFVAILPTLRPVRRLAQIGGWNPTPAAVEDFCDRRIAPHDLLRHAMMSFLAGHDAWFELRVQHFVDERRTPTDDDTRRWRAPFRKVAVLRIPRQVFWPESGMPKSPPGKPKNIYDAAKELTDLGENMSFNPWHALQDHEPVGAINKARRQIYPAIMRFRRDRNEVTEAAVLEGQSAPSYEKLRAFLQGGAVPAIAAAAVPRSVDDYDPKDPPK